MVSQECTYGCSVRILAPSSMTAGSGAPAVSGAARSTMMTSPEISRLRSDGVPSATISPASMIEIRSQSASASSR